MSTWKENDPNSSPERNLIYGQVDNGNGTFTSVPIAATINADGLATLITNASGGGSNTVAATNAGTSATTANPVQGVTGGVPVPVTGSFSFTGKTGTVAVTPTVSTSAYAIGNVVGGLLTFSNALLASQSGVLQSIRLTVKSVQTAGFKLYIFGTQPTNTTWTDHTAPSINSADVGFLSDSIALTAPDSGLGTHTIYSFDGIGKAINAASMSLYGILVTTGTPTFASTSDVSVAINILQD